MGQVLEFRKPQQNTTKFIPALEDLTNQAERSIDTPPRQTGQPAFLFHFPNGMASLRTTQIGYKALILAKEENPEIPLELESVTRGPNDSFYVNAEAQLSYEGSELIELKEALDPWLVVHAYGSDEEDTIDGGYERDFYRVGAAPLPSPNLNYLWTIDFKQHGGLWCYGTPQDLALAKSLIDGNDFVPVRTTKIESGALESFAISSRSQEIFLNQLKSEGFWLKKEDFWCDCHSS